MDVGGVARDGGMMEDEVSDEGGGMEGREGG